MNLRDLKSYKAKMEGEYAKIPITASSKSLQVRKRKEELEYELDVIEKQIMRVQTTVRWKSWKCRLDYKYVARF